MARVDYAPEAVADIKDLFRHIAADAGPPRALRYIQRIERRIGTLEVFPESGRPLEGGPPDLRLIGLDRRVTILFRAQRDAVLILRVLYAGRQP